MSKLSSSTIAEIREMCGKLTNDSSIAMYFGIKAAEVTRIRKALPKYKDAQWRKIERAQRLELSKVRKQAGSRSASRFDGCLNDTSHKDAVSAAQDGSRRLLDAILGYYERRQAL